MVSEKDMTSEAVPNQDAAAKLRSTQLQLETLLSKSFLDRLDELCRLSEAEAESFERDRQQRLVRSSQITWALLEEPLKKDAAEKIRSELATSVNVENLSISVRDVRRLSCIQNLNVDDELIVKSGEQSAKLELLSPSGQPIAMSADEPDADAGDLLLRPFMPRNHVLIRDKGLC
eukprot:Selendium_serpulae@DN2593_c0_g1_i1.p1